MAAEDGTDYFEFDDFYTLLCSRALISRGTVTRISVETWIFWVERCLNHRQQSSHQLEARRWRDKTPMKGGEAHRQLAAATIQSPKALQGVAN